MTGSQDADKGATWAPAPETGQAVRTELAQPHAGVRVELPALSLGSRDLRELLPPHPRAVHTEQLAESPDTMLGEGAAPVCTKPPPRPQGHAWHRGLDLQGWLPTSPSPAWS